MRIGFRFVFLIWFFFVWARYWALSLSDIVSFFLLFIISRIASIHGEDEKEEEETIAPEENENNYAWGE